MGWRDDGKEPVEGGWSHGCGDVGQGKVGGSNDQSQPFITEFAFARSEPTAFPMRERANGTMLSD